MQRPLYAGSPHSMMGGLSLGDDHPQYTSKALTSLLMGPFVSAADPRWNVVPGLGDMTAAFNKLATDTSIPLGSTVIFQPGTYTFTGPLLWARAVNIYAYGAIFSFGNTDLSSTGYAIRIGANTTTDADRTWQRSFEGLTVTRNYGITVASLLYTGFDWCALLECNVQSCRAVGFEQGHFVHGGVALSAGNVHNNYYNLKVTDCRYGIDIADGGAAAPNGWSNENNYIGGRMHLSSTITDEMSGYNYTAVTSIAAGGGGYAIGDTIDLAGGTFSTRAQIQVTNVAAGAVTAAIVTIPGVYTVLPTNPVAQFATSGGGSLATFNMAQAAPGNCHAIRIRYLGAHAPNNNRFYGVTLENEWGRKIYCEGLDNWFEACRYENSNGVVDIEFYDPASAGQYGSRNTVIGGYKLESAIVVPSGGNGPNYDGSGRSVNLNNVLHSAQWFVRGGIGTEVGGSLVLSNSTGANDSLSVEGIDRVKALGLSAGNGTNYSGTVAFRDPATGLTHYYLRLKLEALNKLVLADSSGVDRLALYINGSVMEITDLRANTADLARVEMLGGRAGNSEVPAVQFRNSQQSDYLAALVMSNTSAKRIGLIAEDGGGGVLGKILFYSGAAGAETPRNHLAQGNSAPYPLLVDLGLRVNASQGADGDFQVFGDTVAGLFFVDVSANRVGIGTSTPTARLHVVDDSYFVGKVEIEKTSTDALLVSNSTPTQMFRVDTDNNRTYLLTAEVIIDGGILDHRGSTQISRNAYAVNHTVAADETYVVFTATATCTLPASSATGNRVIIVKAKTGATVTVTPAGGDTVDGAATDVLVGPASATYVADMGTDWDILR